MPKKPKYKVKIEVCDNGTMVTIKRGKECLGARVFEGDTKESYKRQKKWMDDVMSKDKEEQTQKTQKTKEDKD